MKTEARPQHIVSIKYTLPHITDNLQLSINPYRTNVENRVSS